MSSNVFGNQSTPSLISVAEAASKVMKLDEHCGECGAMDHIDEKKGMLPRPGAGAYKTPEERKKDAETKKRLKMFKSLRKEEVEEIVEEVSEKDFDSLKKGDTITIDFKSPMSSGKATFKVTAKNIVGKAKVHKATLKDVKRPGGVKFYLYKRGNKVSLAQGDMAATVSKYTIEQVVSEDEDMEKVVKELENASKMHLGQSKRIKKHLDKMKKEEVELDEVAGKKLALFCDVFCEKGYFSVKQSEKILRTGLDFGLIPRLHADEFVDSDAARLASEINAISADHLMFASDRNLKRMADAGVTSVILPGTTFFLGKKAYVDAGKILEFGGDVAIASDYNPGSCFIQSMPFIMLLSNLYCNLSIDLSFKACTYNAAKVLKKEKQIGLVKEGYKADLLLWSLDSLASIPYSFDKEGSILNVIKNGKVIK